MRTLQTEIVEKGISNQKQIKGQKKPKKAKSTFSRREIEELMGKHRPTYRRVNGAIRSNR